MDHWTNWSGNCSNSSRNGSPHKKSNRSSRNGKKTKIYKYMCNLLVDTACIFEFTEENVFLSKRNGSMRRNGKERKRHIHIQSNSWYCIYTRIQGEIVFLSKRNGFFSQRNDSMRWNTRKEKDSSLSLFDFCFLGGIWMNHFSLIFIYFYWKKSISPGMRPIDEKKYHRCLSKSFWLLLIMGDMDGPFLLDFYSFLFKKIHFY